MSIRPVAVDKGAERQIKRFTVDEIRRVERLRLDTRGDARRDFALLAGLDKRLEVTAFTRDQHNQAFHQRIIT